jgi:hypothetical protein
VSRLFDLVDRFTIEGIIAVGVISLFAIAYFVFPTQQKEGALIAGFAGAWGYYLGNSSAQKKSADQVGESIGLTRAVVRAQSAEKLPARQKEDA